MRRFAGLELIDDALLAETTILKFCRLLETHQLAARMMNVINGVLEDRGPLLKGGTMVDAAFIHPPPSTKNRSKARDPQIHPTKKGKQWYFGMKIHVGADVDSGPTHSVSVTPAHAPDISQLPDLLWEGDRAVFGDKGYVSHPIKRAARRAGVYWAVALKVRAHPPLTAANRPTNRRWSRTRSRVGYIIESHQAPIWLHPGALQGVGQERRPGVHADRLTNLYLVRRHLLA